MRYDFTADLVFGVIGGFLVLALALRVLFVAMYGG